MDTSETRKTCVVLLITQRRQIRRLHTENQSLTRHMAGPTMIEGTSRSLSACLQAATCVDPGRAAPAAISARRNQATPIRSAIVGVSVVILDVRASGPAIRAWHVSETAAHSGPDLVYAHVVDPAVGCDQVNMQLWML